MTLRFIQSYPFWFVVLCLIIGLAYAAILYFRNKRSGFNSGLLALLSVLRFLAVSLIALLILSPLLQRLNRFVEEPLLIFVHDNSQSLLLGPDSAYYSGSFLQEKADFSKGLEPKFETRTYLFGETFRESDNPDYNDRYTDISSIFAGIQSLYSNRNVGAVIIASDGIYNRGSNPVFFAPNLVYPVYTLAMGDTTSRRDLIIKRLNYNRITYLGNQFPLEVEIEAREMAGLGSRLVVSRGSETLVSRNLQFSGNLHHETILFQLEADQTGMQRYLVELLPVEGEVSTLNNRQDFFIEVIDSRQKVLILANSPHPDVGALRLALDENDNYEVTTSLINEFNGQVETYNLVIMHQLPSAQNSAREIIQRLERNQVPVLYVVGARSAVNALNSLLAGLTITPRSADFTEAQPAINPSFALFTLGEKTVQIISQLPPLNIPFAAYQVSAGANALLFQKIGAVVTEQPLILFFDQAERKTGIIAGEGIWRWRLQAFAKTGSHQPIDELIWRMVQYLSVKEDKNLFRLRTDHFVFETDPVIIDAELYNASFELVNEPLVQLTIINEQGMRFSYEMGRTSNAYRLNAGNFPPGEYTYQALTSHAGQVHEAAGKFNVSALNLEGLRTIADHNLLFQIAQSSGGEMYYPGQWNQLADALNNRVDILPVMFSQKEFHELINLRALFLLLLLLLSAEWFLRKWNGSF